MTFYPTRVPVGGTVRSRVYPELRWTVVPDGTLIPFDHVWVSDLRTAAIRDKGRHADPSRTVDAPTRPGGVDESPFPLHRKPGAPLTRNGLAYGYH